MSIPNDHTPAGPPTTAAADNPAADTAAAAHSCCAPAVQADCCAPSEKADCCGPAVEEGAVCGCAAGTAGGTDQTFVDRDGVPVLPVVVIGAGPIGLAAAAHLLERGLEPLVLEAGDQVGAAVAEWGHVPLFSPWRYTIDQAGARLLEPAGWTSPDPSALPTGNDLVTRYLQPLAATPELAQRIRTRSRVVAVTRQGVDKTRSIGREGRPYIVRVHTPDGVTDITAAAVVDASGTWGQRNPLGGSGLPAIGETDAGPWMAGPLPDVLGADRARFAGRHTLVVGMGHSAANTLLSLVRLRREEPGTQISWAIRAATPQRLYGDPAADELPARGALGAQVRDAVANGAITLLAGTTLTAFTPTGNGRLQVRTTSGDLVVDVVAGAAGFRPDLNMLREVRLDIDPGVEAPARLAPLIDPNFHSCGTVEPHGASMLSHPDEDFYIVGMKSYGRAPTFLLATGYEQVRSVAAALAGDQAAADRVKLELPETGVCGTTITAEPAPLKLGFRTGTEHGYSAEQPTTAAAAEPVTAATGCCAAPADTREEQTAGSR